MYDITIDENNDLGIKFGDFSVGNSSMQEIELILLLNKGELKRDPLLGCNLIKFQNATISSNEITQIIRLNLKRDGKTNSVKIIDNQIQIK